MGWCWCRCWSRQCSWCICCGRAWCNNSACIIWWWKGQIGSATVYRQRELFRRIDYIPLDTTRVQDVGKVDMLSQGQLGGGCDSAGHLQVVLCRNCPLGARLVRCFDIWYIRRKKERYIDGVEETVSMYVYGQTGSGGTSWWRFGPGAGAWISGYLVKLTLAVQGVMWTDDRYIIRLQKLMAVDGNMALMILTWCRIWWSLRC